MPNQAHIPLKFPKMVSVKIICLGQLLNNLNSFKCVNCQFFKENEKASVCSSSMILKK